MPITPNEADERSKRQLPSIVFEVVDQMIVEEWNGHSVTLKELDIVKAIAKKMKIRTQKVYDKNYLDFEVAYNQVGWDVNYDKPDYTSTYPATYTFTRKK